MRILLSIISIIFIPKLVLSQEKFPELSSQGKSLNDLIPKNWKILSTSNGDLNKDGISDLVFVIENTDERNIHVNENGFGVDSINLNPRILAIYFGNVNGGYMKNLQSNEFIILQDSPTMDEPFDGVEILKNGVLKIDFHFWFSAGSWMMSSHTYKFRFQNNQFELIGYDASEIHRATGETTDYSINFSTRKMEKITTTFDENEEETIIEEKKSFKLKELKSIQSLGKPFEWEFEGIYL